MNEAIGAMGANEPDAESTTADPYSMKLVAFALRWYSRGFYKSVTQKRVSWLGDRAAIALTKILTDEDVREPQTIKGTLDIIHNSFVYPGAITLAVDKKPKVALLLLDYLQRNV
jgi:hypothetical protein